MPAIVSNGTSTIVMPSLVFLYSAKSSPHDMQRLLVGTFIRCLSYKPPSRRAPFVSRLVPALWHEALSLLSAAAQHGHGSRTQTVPRSSSVAGVLRAWRSAASLLHQLTLRVIGAEVHSDASAAHDVS